MIDAANGLLARLGLAGRRANLASPRPGPAERIDWVDYAKGLSILLVVQYHATLGITEHIGYESWSSGFASFCYTFRMPLFFIVAGLFLARTIDQDWRTYLDRKVVHFAYFYALWVTIKFILKGPQIAEGSLVVWLTEYAFAFVQPFGPLWFIYLLGVFFLATRLLRGVPAPILWIGAAVLHIAGIETGSVVVDQFCSRYVFFLSGYMLAGGVFATARHGAAQPMHAALALAGFLALNGAMLATGAHKLPGATLALGLIGALAFVAVLAALAERGRASFLGYCGARSLPIYLAFFVPMAATRIIGEKLLGQTPVAAEVLGLVVPLAAVIGALVMYWVLPRLGLGFLFERPAWARLAGSTTPRGQSRQAAVGRSRPGLPSAS
ncbi:MAG: acyltransferase family protein [Rhizobiales bacterium]|nr:acyltransferase family protein [Hyphomicrobiales bacterium]